MSAVPAPFALLDLIQGSIVTQAVHAAARLDVAETLADGPLPAAEIAGRVGAHPEATYRLLRMLASYGIFAERGDGSFELTPMAEALRAGAPQSMRRIALLMGHPVHWEDWSHLTESVQTGEPSLPKYRGMSAWEFFGANPEYGAVFGQGMTNLSELETEPVVAAYDFSRFGTIVDVGGGRGTLLAAVLQQAPGSRGVLYSPSSREDAEQELAAYGVADRCTIEEGTLFDPVPAGADAYLLKHVVHDWPEPQALEMLRNVRKSVSPDSRILLMEFVLDGDLNEPHSGKLVDLWLLLLVGGRERTAQQYRELFAEAGFELTGITPTSSALSIVEARPA